LDQKTRIHTRREELMDNLAQSAASAGAIASMIETLQAEPSRYFNRELSWLAFNRRVLEEACTARHPLLERLRFLSISASNLDEFFMVRVAGLKAHQAMGVEELSPEGLTVAQQLSAIMTEADQLVTSQHEVWATLQTDLDGAGMHVVADEALDCTIIGAARR
jgi:polyphosphate kinase